MTATEVRELDAWIGEHVFGRRRVEPETFYCWPSVEEIETLKKAFPNAVAVNYMPIEHYSTDPAAAMRVLEKCVKITDQVSIVECEGTWAITEGDGNGTDPNIPNAEAETLPLAICKFAKILFEGPLK